jgi:diaminohydroxyphosphoribosylaminopyrimidine deaminase/5-amino-6-(5-phosphoribosylamino)uracil reductase
VNDVCFDRDFMSVALALGRRGLGQTWPNPAVGAVIVRNGIVVGRGWTQPGGRPHAETEAIGRAGNATRGATMYVTLEPCSHHGKTPPCADAVAAAGVARVVSALEDPNPEVAGQGHARLRDAGISVDVGVCAEEAARDHAGHIRRMREGRPHVCLKLAVSADGKAGLAGRRPAAITGEEARARVHVMRAMHDAVLTGIGTVLADDPQLTCRLPGMAKRSPVRVVLDSRLQLPLQSRLVQTARDVPVWLMAAEDVPQDKEQPLRACGVEIFRVGAPKGLDLATILAQLAQQGITRVMVEAGPRVAAKFVNENFVDETVLLRAPATLGADAIDALEGMPLTRLTQSPRFRSRGMQKLGVDTMEVFERR